MPSFADINTKERLALALGTPLERLDEYAAHPYQTSFYEVRGIPKRGAKRKGEYRTVYVATETWIKTLHKNIAVLVNANASFPDCVTGFRDHIGIKDNAAPHCGARLVLHADMKDFFDTITLHQVHLAFRHLHAPDSIAALLAQLSTIDGYLCQGTRCSPAIANVVARDLDAKLLVLAKSNNARYTRYADNLTISGDRVPSNAEVERAITECGFAMREACMVQRRGRHQFVTGLSVVDKVPRLPRRLKQQMRLVMHHVSKRGVDAHIKAVEERDREPYPLTEAGMEGMLRFMHSIESSLADKLTVKFEKGKKISEAERAEKSEDDEDYD